MKRYMACEKRQMALEERHSEYGYNPPFTFFLIIINTGRKSIIEKNTMGGLFNERSNC